MRRGTTLLLLSLAAVIIGAVPAAAQVTEVDRFDVAGFSFLPPDVAVGADGTIVFIWTEPDGNEHRTATRHFSATGTPLGAGVLVDEMDGVRETGITARPDGTFVAAWHRRSTSGSSVYGRRLDAAGAPVGDTWGVTASSSLAALRAVAGTATGSLFIWRQRAVLGRAFDATGSAIAPEFPVLEFGSNGDAAALPDGGYVVVSDLTVRLFDGDGTPRGPATFFGYAVNMRRIAVDPNGAMVVVGIGSVESTNHGGVWMRRLDAAGAAVGPPVLVRPAYSETESYVPDVELDPQGNALVVWSGTGTPAAIQQVRGRAYDSSNAPLGYEFVVADEVTDAVRIARLADGHFVTTWKSFAGVSAKVLSLCLPGVAQCGDGVVHAQCEQCDDGAGNSDTAPDACRTSCLASSCGDGVLDGGEECDDGNLASCDGCSATCVVEAGLVCGDGIAEPTCGQLCDDGNATIGDGCTSQCAIEPIYGGGSPTTDCRSVFVVDNPGNAPLLDTHGAFRTNHRCVDDDPTCDFDGGSPGACTFHVRVCANAPGLIECFGEARMAAWTIDKPSAKQAATKPSLAAVRASFMPVPGVVVGPISEVCTDWLPVPVPLRGVAGNYKKGRVTVGSRAILYEDAGVDKDKLKLECLPAGG